MVHCLSRPNTWLHGGMTEITSISHVGTLPLTLIAHDGFPFMNHREFHMIQGMVRWQVSGGGGGRGQKRGGFGACRFRGGLLIEQVLSEFDLIEGRAPRDENVFHGGVVQPVSVHFDHQILHVSTLHRPVTAVDLRPYA